MATASHERASRRSRERLALVLRGCCLGCVLLLGCSGNAFGALLNELRDDPYPLDAIDRDARGDAGCPAVELTAYGGTSARFSPPLRVTPPFMERLARFERISDRIAREMFGRAPSHIRHAGAYLCRPIRTRRDVFSEHALGNAVDVTGFDFPRMPRGDAGVSELPAPLRRPFQIRVARHWRAPERAEDQLRQAFLHRLVRELKQDDVFRGMIGPPAPRHRTHLHLDMGRWRYRRFETAPPKNELTDASE